MAILRMGRSTKSKTYTYIEIIVFVNGDFFVFDAASIEILIDGQNVSRKIGILHKFKYLS